MWLHCGWGNKALGTIIRVLAEEKLALRDACVLCNRELTGDLAEEASKLDLSEIISSISPMAIACRNLFHADRTPVASKESRS